MGFELPTYQPPDFLDPRLSGAPDARLEPVLRPGVAPDGFHAMTIFPEYFRIRGRWVLAEESRMDCVAVVRDDGTVDVREFRRLQAGDRVVVGRTETGEDGILVHADGFPERSGSSDKFAFRTGRSRETSYSLDYDRLYDLLRHDRDHGRIAWVLGPAATFDHDSRQALAHLVRKGFVHAVLGGNALATHDLEAAWLRTALGQDIYTQQSVPDGHYHHLDVINAVRGCGSIARFIEEKGIRDGILQACHERGIPVVLAGSIRDDGPLPDVLTDTTAAQDAMRREIRQATVVLGLATQLHTIAAGNMTPSYRVVAGQVRPVYLYSVDVSEFAVNKLRDRGTLEVTSIVTNIQDFVVNLARNLA